MPAGDAQFQRWAQERPRAGRRAGMYEQLRSAQEQEQRSKHFTGHRQQLRIYHWAGPRREPSHLATLMAAYIVTIPIKFLSQPVIDWLGTPAWQDMSRRTLMAYDGDLGGNLNNPESRSANGRPARNAANARSIFPQPAHWKSFAKNLRKSLRLINPKADPQRGLIPLPIDVTLIGHSMGTMVLNEWLRRDLLESKNLSYANIVYMAAACSVRDFGRAVVPYLLQHAQTQFYNLMLHPLADLRERRRAFDTPPRGSLLVWLDSFLADPQTPLDRTMGRWDNIISATELIPAFSSRAGDA